MSDRAQSPVTESGAAGSRGLWLAYAGLSLMCWLLYAMARTEWQRGSMGRWTGIYEATWNLGPPVLLGIAALPWARWLASRPRAAWQRVLLHVGGAFVFLSGWQALDYATSLWFYGAEHADATFQRQLLWQAMWGVFVYLALMLGFGGALAAQRATRAALSAARAEAALVRAELAAISGKLNPHFLFNTLNSLQVLTRRDPAAAEQALLRFSRLMRYVLDTTRGAADRVTLQEELDFVRDYLELEALRLGGRLRVHWQIDPATVDDPIPPLTLQPLVENSIVHGIAPQLGGGTVRIEASRTGSPGAPEAALALRVADDGAGCAWPPAEGAPSHTGVGLSALRRRFELDFEGRAKLSVQSAPGAGFKVEILIPCAALHA